MAGDAADRAAAAWFERRSGAWQSTEAALPGLEGGRPISADEAREVLDHYPELARDLALGRRLAPGSPLTRRIELLYARVHRAIFRRPFSLSREIAATFRHEAAASARRLSWHIGAVTLGFLLAGWAGWWLVSTYPELVTLFASEDMIAQVQKGELWTDDLLNVVPSSLLSVGIFTNNIVVTLTAVSLGALYGLGTLYIIGLNGLMLGGVLAFTARHDMAGRLLEFVCAHGWVELSVIAVAGAVGLYIGEAIARPGEVARTESFRRAVAACGPLLVVCVIFLVGAGLIEGYVSPDPRFSLPMRVTIGIGYWLLFLLVLVRRPVKPSPATRDGST